MGQDVVDVDNLLSEVIAHNCKKLCSLGVLRIRDSRTVRSLTIAFNLYSIVFRVCGYIIFYLFILLLLIFNLVLLI